MRETVLFATSVHQVAHCTFGHWKTTEGVERTAELRQLREQPLWTLLASLNAPLVAGILQELLPRGEKVLRASALLQRL